ncbi:hypothetical protein AB6A40_003242 [Gnathostoma spinigerum]|uniref:Uncharacterized protein n=1 Tax=Gnathostoma spinigerum TaxID=75299 RepID=A0ABD6E938_9BILA
MFKLFRSKKANKENEELLTEERDPSQLRSSESASTHRDERRSHFASPDSSSHFVIPTAPYHVTSQRRAFRATRSCYEGNEEGERHRGASFNRSLLGSQQKSKGVRYSTSGRKTRITSEYGSCDPSPSNQLSYNRELDDSEGDTWNTERIINELRLELRMSNDRKNYYKDLYKRERQDRLRDRELRDLVEKKLMDDLRMKEIECNSHLARIKQLEQQSRHLSSFQLPIRDTSMHRAPQYCTPSTSNTASTMAGAGEALSSTSELFACRTPFMSDQPCGNIIFDDLKLFDNMQRHIRSGDTTLQIEEARSSKEHQFSLVSPIRPFVDLSNRSFIIGDDSKEANGILEEEKQSDFGYFTNSECASEVRTTVRRALSDGDCPLKYHSMPIKTNHNDHRSIQSSSHPTQS